MKYYSNTLFIVLFYALPLYQMNAQKWYIIPIDPNKRVDTTIVRLIDITGDSKVERIELTLKALSFRSPISWTMRILSNSDTLYTYRVKDNYEFMFGGPPDNDSSYLKLKYQFFFQNFVDLEVVHSLDNDLAFKRDYGGSIYNISREWLVDKKHIPSAQASRIAKSLERKIRQKKLPILFHSDGNVDVCLPLVFVKEVNCLIPIYSD